MLCSVEHYTTPLKFLYSKEMISLAISISFYNGGNCARQLTHVLFQYISSHENMLQKFIFKFYIICL